MSIGMQGSSSSLSTQATPGLFGATNTDANSPSAQLGLSLLQQLGFSDAALTATSATPAASNITARPTTSPYASRPGNDEYPSIWDNVQQQQQQPQSRPSTTLSLGGYNAPAVPNVGISGAVPNVAYGGFTQPNAVGTFSNPASVAGVSTPSAVGAARGSSYGANLSDILTNPAFKTGYTPAESALISNITAATNAASAGRGLGAASQPELLAALAPTLVNLRQNEINNLQNAYGTDIGAITAERGQDVTQRGQSIDSLLQQMGYGVTQRGQDISSLLQQQGTMVGQNRNIMDALLQSAQLDQAAQTSNQNAALNTQQLDLQAQLANQAANQRQYETLLQALFGLAGGSMPQIVSGTTGSSYGIGFGPASAGSGGGR